MATSSSTRRDALGIFLDSVEIRAVHLVLRDGKPVVVQAESSPLSTGVEGHGGGAQRMQLSSGFVAGGAGRTGGEMFGEEPADDSMQLGLGQGAEDRYNHSIMLSVLQRFPSLQKLSVGLIVSEPSVAYAMLEPGRQTGSDPKELFGQLRAALATTHAEQFSDDQLAVVPAADGQQLGLGLPYGLTPLAMLEEVKGNLGGRLPKIVLADSAATALLGLTRACYHLPDDAMTAVIHVGLDSTRMMILRGSSLFALPPLITEGSQSDGLTTTIYSRLLLALDEGHLSHLDHILLCGEAAELDLASQLSPLFPASAVEPMRLSPLEGGLTDGLTASGEPLSAYALSLAVAWRVLMPRHPDFSSVNLVPQRVQESQKSFRLAWHGWLMLLALPLVTLLLTYHHSQLQSKTREIDRNLALGADLAGREAQLTGIRDSLQTKIATRKRSLELLDSLTAGARWSDNLSTLSSLTADIGGLWLTDVNSSNQGYVLDGYALARARLPKLTDDLRSAELNEIAVANIRQRDVFKFHIIVAQASIDSSKIVRPPPPPPQPVATEQQPVGSSLKPSSANATVPPVVDQTIQDVQTVGTTSGAKPRRAGQPTAPR